VRIAVLSDVHANLRALEAVLAEIDAAGFDGIWCLGDLVGYGPKPNECAALLQERATICLAGNHDLVVLGKIPIDSFAGEAAAAARWTRTVLDESTRAFLGSLEPKAATSGAELFHGSPRDPVWDYVLSDESAASALALTEAPLVLVGHSHVALEISNGGERRGEPAPAGTQQVQGGVGGGNMIASSCFDNIELIGHPDSLNSIFQWYYEGVAIPGEIDTILHYSAYNYTPGTYQFRAQLKRTSNGATSGFSDPVSVSVS